ncbi:DinB family protein [Ornithinibacillus scapharcae]|uniref:DinB family protein n=1 Tax=Ornithinibacillus scapharcae TaxID=1147159 RepID=UPI000225BCA5|nr:DinB family protein [Ornithinibacillus scapharcae]
MGKLQRKIWNDNHKLLRKALVRPETHSEAVTIFLSQHALLHNNQVGHSEQVTLVEHLLKNLDETTFRQYPVSNPDTKNSIAWHLWHISRIEDMTMNILIADAPQVLQSENWLAKLNIPFAHSGNDMTEEEIACLSKSIDLEALLAYRLEVGKQTRIVVNSLKTGDFQLAIESKRMERLFDEQAVAPKSEWLANYWNKKNVAGLLLMPATRHNFLHLNKSVRIKERLQKQLNIEV